MYIFYCFIIYLRSQSPSPNWPQLFLPHPNIVPEHVSVKQWKPPDAICTMGSPWRLFNSAGLSEHSPFSPIPNWPYWLSPQENILPPGRKRKNRTRSHRNVLTATVNIAFGKVHFGRGEQSRKGWKVHNEMPCMICYPKWKKHQCDHISCTVRERWVYINYTRGDRALQANEWGLL